MKKSCLIVAGLFVLGVLACILGVGGWLVWRSYVSPMLARKVEPPKSTMRQTGKRPELPGVDMRVHSVAEGRAFSGWPLLVRASVRCAVSADSQQPVPLTIAGPGGSWQEAVRLAVQDANGTTVQWPWHQPKTERGPMRLDGRSGLEWVWWLTGDETRGIQPGKYRLNVLLDLPAGSVNSRPSVVDFQAPGQVGEGQEARRELQLARVEALGGNSPAALARLKALLTRSPKDIEALSFCAELLSDAGDLDEALQMYNRAVAAWYEANPNASTEPVLLLKERRRVPIGCWNAEAASGSELQNV